ncbi:MAG: hypothetical protein ACT4OK_10745 [Gemmobacter sp.]
MLTLVLAACTLALPGGKADAPAPLATEAIEVTTLDAAGAGTAPVSAAPEEPEQAEGGEVASDNPTATPEADDPAEATPPPEEAAPPPAPLSPAALACQRRGGRYIKTGSGDLRACVKETGDGGKQCRRETDCVGSCLARSGTCAPVTPLFGCNEIFQADGRRVTLCLD